MKSKIEKLKALEMEFQDLQEKLDLSEAQLESIGLDFALNVVDILSGKLGFVRTYSETKVEFIVTLENNKSYIVDNIPFDNWFLELPREIVEKHCFNSSPVFLINHTIHSVGLIVIKDYKQGESSLVVWEDGSSAEIKHDSIVWKNENVAILSSEPIREEDLIEGVEV